MSQVPRGAPRRSRRKPVPHHPAYVAGMAFLLLDGGAGAFSFFWHLLADGVRGAPYVHPLWHGPLRAVLVAAAVGLVAFGVGQEVRQMRRRRAAEAAELSLRPAGFHWGFLSPAPGTACSCGHYHGEHSAPCVNLGLHRFVGASGPCSVPGCTCLGYDRPGFDFEEEGWLVAEMLSRP